jgi:hypothetical protein
MFEQGDIVVFPCSHSWIWIRIRRNDQLMEVPGVAAVLCSSRSARSIRASGTADGSAKRRQMSAEGSAQVVVPKDDQINDISLPQVLDERDECATGRRRTSDKELPVKSAVPGV